MDCSAKEKWELLSALHKHSTNLEALQISLPNWSREKLQYYLKSFRNIAHRRQGQEESIKEVTDMERWLTHTNNMHIVEGTFSKKRNRGLLPRNWRPSSHAPLLSKAMLYVSEVEKHPPVSSPSQPDYREIYRYLSQVLAGEEPSQLSSGSAAKLIEMLSKVEASATKNKHKWSLNHYLHMNPPSYITSWAKKRCTKAAMKQQAADSKACPLFSEAEDTDVISHEHLDKDDPFFEQKIEKALECRKGQTASASAFSDVPGLNPYGFTTNALIKPDQETMKVLQKV